MRALYISYVMILLTIALSTVGEMNNLNMRDKGYPLIYYSEAGVVAATPNSSSFNTTLQNYGLNAIPSQAGTNYYLGTGGQMLTTYNLFKDIFLFSTLGLSQFLDNTFPTMPINLKILIDTMATLNNIVAAISFLRGVGLKWI